MTHPDYIEPPDHVEPPVEWTDAEFRDYYGCKYDDDLTNIPCYKCEHRLACLDSVAGLPMERSNGED